MKKLKIKRVFDEVDGSDGYRILVDRLWPRGVKKENLSYDWWPKSMAPSDELRKSFHHESEKFEDFKEKYLTELEENGGKTLFLDTVKDQLRQGTVTFLFAAKDEEQNQAVVLKEWTEDNLK